MYDGVPDGTKLISGLIQLAGIAILVYFWTLDNYQLGFFGWYWYVCCCSQFIAVFIIFIAQAKNGKLL